MSDRESISFGPNEPDPSAYWEDIAGYLLDAHKTHVEHAERVYRDIDSRLKELSQRHFSHRGSLGPEFLAAHQAMGVLLSLPPGEAKDNEIWKTFPAFQAKADAVLSYLKESV